MFDESFHRRSFLIFTYREIKLVFELLRHLFGQSIFLYLSSKHF